MKNIEEEQRGSIDERTNGRDPENKRLVGVKIPTRRIKPSGHRKPPTKTKIGVTSALYSALRALMQALPADSHVRFLDAGPQSARIAPNERKPTQDSPTFLAAFYSRPSLRTAGRIGRRRASAVKRPLWREAEGAMQNSRSSLRTEENLLDEINLLDGCLAR
ncbi:hypothetical protein KM043_005953 [Ampulex compressa]|nr:hypothetical protein KM043_005953 [Ampulex compressa]